LRPLSKALQREVVDIELRNRLWSALKITIWDNWKHPGPYRSQTMESMVVDALVQQIWFNHLKLPLDTVPEFTPGHPHSAYGILRDTFFKSNWWQFYDFLEFILQSCPDPGWRASLKDLANSILTQENAAYRIVDSEVVDITDQHEIEAIESALEHAIKSVGQHLHRSLELLSDKSAPDYRNSIKESISAVESMSQVIAGLPGATLSDCIKVLKAKSQIHPAFEQALMKLYGYTSDGGGIRHALTEDTVTPSYADAKFMLVAASAFINFLWTKAAELKLTLRK